MDLRITGPSANAIERAAVDSVLGAPSSGWAGGARDMRAESHTALLSGRDARSRRDLLLPTLHAVQARVGWVSRGALNYISLRLTIPPAEIFGVASFYHLIATEERPKAVAHLCDDIACRLVGSEAVAADLEQALGPPGCPNAGAAMTWFRSPCLGQCERGPAALVTLAGETPRTVGLAPVDAKGVLEELSASAPIRPNATSTSVPQLGSTDLRLLSRVGVVPPGSLAGYRAAGGYEGFARAIQLGPQGVVDEVTRSQLVGRGGAAFSTGRKWAAVASAKQHPHYVICNADESEPGTFKDRILLEEDPFAVIEGMTIAAFATACEQGFVYLRGEYPLAAERMEVALAAARAAGLLGPNVNGAGFAFDIEIRRGGGAYICGEETALFNSIEGKRGEPRNKPPFPVEVGLFGRPTVVNNVETLVNVPLLLRSGGAVYAQTGTPGSAGPKLFCVSGHVVRPGLYEVPFGRTLGEVLAMAGGVANGRPIQAILLGGAAGTFVGPEALSTPLTFEGTRAIGASLGSGVILVVDDTVNLFGLLRRIAEFFRDESCGQCVPCRVGTVRQEELLDRLSAGRTSGSRARELALLKEIGQAMRDASICGLGQTASSAIESALFRLAPTPRSVP